MNNIPRNLQESVDSVNQTLRETCPLCLLGLAGEMATVKSQIEIADLLDHIEGLLPIEGGATKALCDLASIVLLTFLHKEYGLVNGDDDNEIVFATPQQHRR